MVANLHYGLQSAFDIPSVLCLGTCTYMNHLSRSGCCRDVNSQFHVSFGPYLNDPIVLERKSGRIYQIVHKGRLSPTPPKQEPNVCIIFRPTREPEFPYNSKSLAAVTFPQEISVVHKTQSFVVGGVSYVNPQHRFIFNCDTVHKPE